MGIVGELVPVHERAGGAGALVSGHESHANRLVAGGHGDPRARRCGDPGGHAGHDLERDARRIQILGLLGAASEDVGVAPLEAHDALALPPQAHEQRVDLTLRYRVVPRFLAHRVELHALGQVGGEDRLGKTVVHDRVGRHEPLPSAHRQQPGVAGSGADE